ncbi:cytochrome P450 6a2-like [Eupeodes corollae]|uniref:cytochrome P450 6a2-like n=1 Tax=Eupeodes corollae TaxID=290404 RepID=UPI00249109B4|nr:cytochrome P450 6a2-like [Eupeodes corollae]
MEPWSVTFYIIIMLASVLMYFLRQYTNYWTRRGIPCDTPHFPYGNLDGFKKTHHIRDIVRANYEKYKHTGPFGGFFFLLRRSVIIYDLDLAKNILIKDFNNFSDRAFFHNERDDPLTGHLFALESQEWRQLRNKLSPSFSSGKMKSMFPTVLSVSEKLKNTFDRHLGKDSIIEVKDLLARYTIDVIGRCAFGLECNSLRDPNSEFRAMGVKSCTKSRHGNIIDSFLHSFPKLSKLLRLRQIDEEVHQFYMRIVRETVQYREKNSIKQNDLMNLLIELKNSKQGLSIEEVAAQAFVFLIAGFESSASSMAYALFELALNQSVQDKLRAEINAHFDKNGGVFTYEDMTEMHYMEMVMKEVLRKYLILSHLRRDTKNDYQTSDPKYIIPKGTLVIIPADAYHRDPEIYPDPDKFDPERFSPEEMKKRHPIAWLGFGDGPRNCVAMRFGKMQSYIGLSYLLRNFKFHYCEKTPSPLETDVSVHHFTTKGGIYLRVERI